MRYLFLGRLLACLLIASTIASPALAQLSPCGDHVPSKTTLISHGPTLPPGTRQGGDTIDDAVLIPGIPFAITGTTCGYTNDYDEDLVLVACNDDFYSDYTSALQQVELQSRLSYFIVIDGYGDGCGEYALELREYVPCEVLCPAGAFIEGEPPIAENYYDETNGGCCGGDHSSFQTLPGRSNGTQVLCGRSGFFTVDGGNTRDTDWFVVTFGETGVIEVRGDADQPTYLFELGPMDCNTVGVIQNVEIGPCAEGSLTIIGEPFTDVWVWVGPTGFMAPDGSDVFAYDYVLWFDGLAPAGVTAVPGSPDVVPRSLSTVKGLFD